MESLRNPNAVAAIVDALRHVHGDSAARLMLIQGMTLADLIGTLLRSPVKNREAVKLVRDALGSDDFLIEPEIAGPSHITYVYDPPGSLHVVDIAIDTTEGTVASAEIRLRLRGTGRGLGHHGRLEKPNGMAAAWSTWYVSGCRD